MWLSTVRKRILFDAFVKSQTANTFSTTAPLVVTPRIYVGRAQTSCESYYYSTLQGINNEIENVDDDNVGYDAGQMSLAKSLASLVVESSSHDYVEESNKAPTSRVGMKRLLEMRVKKRVKQQFVNGKFHDLVEKVVADPMTLMDAYNCIRVSSNVDMTSSEVPGICLQSLAEELVNGKFDVKANTFALSTKDSAPEELLVLPNLKLKVVQEAIRIVLEVVFKPHFSKLSHGGRSGRGHLSAFKYICKEISKPDWWFTVLPNKKVDAQVLAKLIATIEDKIQDPLLCAMIQSMFNAQVLNLEFGGFPKGQGLPQEGVLSPILMNIYLILLDEEFHRMTMRYEALDSCPVLDNNRPQSQLRNWFRRQIKGNVDNTTGCENHGLRVYSCRFMDEIFFAVSGSKEVALSLKSEVQNYFQDFLHLDVNSDMEIIPYSSQHGVYFAGASIVRTIRDTPGLRAVHKLKEKVKLFALQKQEIWDDCTVRVGKKWLAHGLRKVKESEIRHLADSNTLLSKVSHYRKAGMETDHWYKHLIKIWMQDVNAKAASSEEFILSRYIAEPALPPALRDSFYEFQRRVEEYTSSETESLLSLLPSSAVSQKLDTITKVVAPVNVIKKRLLHYGLVNHEGYPRAVSLLILQDSSQVIDWFSGIVCRWLRWYSECDNFSELKLIVSDQVRKSCIRTLALKYRMRECEVEKRFESELSKIPFSQDIENEIGKEILDSCALDNDEAMMYGICYSGLCQLSLAIIVSQSRPCNCFVVGCSDPAPCVYTLHVMERQKFPSWNTGFSSCIHPSLNRRRIGLCKQHLKDLYLGNISLQSIDFGSSE